MGVPTREVEMATTTNERVRAVRIPAGRVLFEEPGTLKRVAELARAWFERHLLERS